MAGRPWRVIFRTVLKAGPASGGGPGILLAKLRPVPSLFLSGAAGVTLKLAFSGARL